VHYAADLSLKARIHLKLDSSISVPAAAIAFMCIGTGWSFGGFSGLNYVNIAEDCFQLRTAALRAFYQLLLALAHFRHYIEFLVALSAFQVVKRHVHHLSEDYSIFIHC
jgi:hypothetical protein